MKAIRAGKHVHFNKTMTISTAEATQLIEEAEKYGVKIVCPRTDDRSRSQTR